MLRHISHVFIHSGNAPFCVWRFGPYDNITAYVVPRKYIFSNSESDAPELLENAHHLSG